MKNKRNYYRILHVQPDAPREIIQSSYRTLMQKLKAHPDLGGEEWNATVINEAYQVLMDANKRKEYDTNLFQKESHNTLGKQNQNQRQKPTTETTSAGGDWKPFEATVIDKI